MIVGLVDILIHRPPKAVEKLQGLIHCTIQDESYVYSDINKVCRICCFVN
jgi:hypothetical protein